MVPYLAVQIRVVILIGGFKGEFENAMRDLMAEGRTEVEADRELFGRGLDNYRSGGLAFTARRTNPASPGRYTLATVALAAQIR